MRSEIGNGSGGPFIDASQHFPASVYAYITLKGVSGTDEASIIRFLEERGCACKRVHRVEQVHSGRVVETDRAPCEADGLVSFRDGEAVRVVTADCVPILMATGDGERIAAVHAGWKGTLARIAGEAARRLQVSGSNVLAYIGPAIGRCCYSVDPARYDAFREAFPAWLPDDGKPVLDLQQLNARILQESGVAPENIHVEDRCTACSVGLCCSYRRDGNAAGRMAAVIGRRA